MEQPQPSFIRRGLPNILFIATCMLIKYFEKKDNTLEHTNQYKKNHLIVVNEQNYKKILKDNWILYINVTETSNSIKNRKQLLKLCNVAILTADTLFACKLISHFNPNDIRNVYLVSNGHCMSSNGKIERIDLYKDIDIYDVIMYFIMQKLEIIFRLIEVVIETVPLDSTFYLIMFIIEFYMSLFAK